MRDLTHLRHPISHLFHHRAKYMSRLWPWARTPGLEILGGAESSNVDGNVAAIRSLSMTGMGQDLPLQMASNGQSVAPPDRPWITVGESQVSYETAILRAKNCSAGAGEPAIVLAGTIDRLRASRSGNFSSSASSVQCLIGTPSVE